MADNKVNSGLLEFSEDQKVFVALDAETSEVKKAVTIDGDGVETDIQGVQPSGKKEITTTEEVNVASYATAQVVDEDLIAGNIKKDVDILGVVGSYEPEAPASDFSTARVTVVNETADGETIYIPYIEEAVSEQQPAYAGGSWQFSGSETINLTAILYKGTLIAILTSGNISVSGNASLISASVVAITGDCVITINDIL